MGNKRRKYKINKRFYVVVAIVVIMVVSVIFTSIVTLKAYLTMKESGTVSQQLEKGISIMAVAKGYINSDLTYDDGYYAGGYPPENVGVCTDVIWQGFTGITVDLKALVDKDIKNNLSAYEGVVDTPDPNLDFRRVEVLEIFFERNAEILTNDPSEILQWQPGDIVTFESSHIAIVSNLRNLWGQPYIIQHGKDPAGDEDRLYKSDGMEISGHFRWES